MSSYPTQLVFFKVQNGLVAKNISDQNFTIDGKQFKIREYLETSFAALGEVPIYRKTAAIQKMREMCWTRL